MILLHKNPAFNVKDYTRKSNWIVLL